MSSIFQIDKDKLYKFISNKFKGNWEECYDHFSLRVLEEPHGLVMANIVFYFSNYEYENGIFDREVGGEINVSIQEIEKFYKKHFKLNNFR